MVILFGMLMMFNKLIMVIWYWNLLLNDSGVFILLNINLMFYLFYIMCQDDFNGIVLIVGNIVLLIFFLCLLIVVELLGMLLWLVIINGLLFKIWFYVDSWIYNDLWYVLMLGCISGIVVGFICYFIYVFWMWLGKEILMVIKYE